MYRCIKSRNLVRHKYPCCLQAFSQYFVARSPKSFLFLNYCIGGLRPIIDSVFYCILWFLVKLLKLCCCLSFNCLVAFEIVDVVFCCWIVVVVVVLSNCWSCVVAFSCLASLCSRLPHSNFQVHTTSETNTTRKKSQNSPLGKRRRKKAKIISWYFQKIPEIWFELYLLLSSVSVANILLWYCSW